MFDLKSSNVSQQEHIIANAYFVDFIKQINNFLLKIK